MKMEGIPFGTTDWESIPRTEHKGTTGVAYWRTANFGSIQVRAEAGHELSGRRRR